jgi:three-Cys-motif partner protein
MPKKKARYDEIGYWSEIKLEILRKYAWAYSKILTSRRANDAKLTHFYIDGFAGAGVHISKSSGELVAGSPLNALNLEPPFRHYFLVDLDGGRIEQLKELVGDRRDVTLLEGDCNEVLLTQVLPKVSYRRRERALCLLDPYGLHLNWDVLAAAGRSNAIDLFLNFPIMDMNRNALKKKPGRVQQAQAARMTAFWGDESWREAAYRPKAQGDFFESDVSEKTTNERVVEAFRQRLKEVAGFRNVPAPMPMRNKTNAVLYYLFFASQNDTGNKIFNEISAQYRDHRPDARRKKA